MKVRDLGEFGLIERLTQAVTAGQEGRERGGTPSLALRVDMGDDTAAWECGQLSELATTDTVVEGVHFTRASTSWQDVGWKIMAANVSDIAAMGGLPLYALVTLGLPPDTEVADVDALYQGMLELGNLYGMRIVGGDVVRSPVVFVTVALTGVTDKTPLLRSAARPGDLVAVIGYLGSSAGGLELLTQGTTSAGVQDSAAQYLTQAHRRPRPAVEQGRALAAAGVLAAMDISDGLVDDLGKLCQASGMAAQVRAHQLPIHPHLKEAFPQRHLELALQGGEDYTLLFATPAAMMKRVLEQLPAPVATVGEIVQGQPGKVSVVDASGEELISLTRGWDHLR
ncbi:MAG: thiamine-phosphate kinase [Dehalococcoidia bacterium]